MALSEQAHRAAMKRWQEDYLAPYELRHAQQRAQRDEGRPRSGASGPSGQKKTAAQRYDDQRRRSRENYHKKVKAAQAKGDRILCGWGELRWREEQRLLGERFVVAGQRVRIVGVPELEGQCGTVVVRALLCEESPNRQIVRWPAVDAAGALVLSELSEPQQQHHVRLDGHAGAPVALWPANIEPWPRAGQLVRGASVPAEVDPDDIVTIVSFTGSVTTARTLRHGAFWAAIAEQDGCDHASVAAYLRHYRAFLNDVSATANHTAASIYLCSQTIFARRAHVDAVSGPLRPGALVQLLHPHPWCFMQADLSRYELSGAQLVREWGEVAHLGDSLFVLKDMCSECGDGLELERLFCTPHFDASSDGSLPMILEPLSEDKDVPPRFTCLRCDHFRDDLSSDDMWSEYMPCDSDEEVEQGVLV